MPEAINYPLGYSEEEGRRLAVQAALYEDLTEDTFRRAGILPGMRVLDIGCGVGDVSFLAARMVGPTGSVLGLDRTVLSVETARFRASRLGLDNVQFAAAELDTYEAPRSFDAVVGRFILLYLPNPAQTLRQLQASLRPGGIVAFQEFEMPQFFTTPPSKLLIQARDWIMAALTAAAAETRMGSKLLTTFLAAGLPRPTMIAASRVDSGPDSPAYEYITHTVRSLLPLIERLGIASSAEVGIETLAQRLREDVVASERVVFMPLMVSAWTRLPD